MDRASQAEAKYREALEEALRAAREHGNASPQAVAAWDIVDEIEVMLGGGEKQGLSVVSLRWLEQKRAVFRLDRWVYGAVATLFVISPSW